MRSTEPDFGRSVRRGVLWALGFLAAIALGLLWLGPEEALAQPARIGLPVLLALLGLSLSNYLLRAVRWQILCRALGVRVPFARNTLYFLSGFAFAVTPGKLGEVVRLWLLRRHHGAAYARTLGLMVMDRLTDAVPLLVLCLLGAGRIAGQEGTVPALIALGLVGFVLLHPAWLVVAIKLTYARVRRAPRLFGRTLRLARVLRALTEPAVLARALVLGLLGWSAEIVGAWLVLKALAADVGLLTIVFVFSFSMLVGALPIFPGGVGGTEGTMVGLLLLLDVHLATAVSATAIISLATLWFAVGIGFAVLPFALHPP